MNTTKTEYRDHKIVIQDATEFSSDGVTGKLAKPPITTRVIEVDDIDVTSRCWASNTDAERTEAAKRFIDRIYPKGKLES
jgi:hypothetical protein